MFGGVLGHDGASGQAHGADSSGTAVPAAIVQQAEAVAALDDTGVAVEVAAAGRGVQPEPHAHIAHAAPLRTPDAPPDAAAPADAARPSVGGAYSPLLSEAGVLNRTLSLSLTLYPYPYPYPHPYPYTISNPNPK